MPGKVTLVYFPFRGRGEIVRYILHAAGVQHEEKTVTLEQWETEHKKAIMGAVPYIEVDGKQLGETLAICRYLAKEYGLYPKTTWEQALADMYVDGTNDLWSPSMPYIMAMFFEKNMAKANEEWAKFKSQTLKPFMERYTGFLKSNNSGWFVGSEMSWADLYIAEALDRYESCFPNDGVFDGFPELRALRDKVHALPTLRGHIANRKW